MANEEQFWSQRHSHESSSVSYGHFGTPLYDSLSHEWTFIRHKEPAKHSEDNVHGENSPSFLEIFDDVELVVALADAVKLDHDVSVKAISTKDLPELGPAFKAYKIARNKQSVISLDFHENSVVAFGSAVWLRPDGEESGGLVVPVMAYATDVGRNRLQLVCLSNAELDFSTNPGTRKIMQIASLQGGPQASWLGVEPILQVAYSTRDREGHGDTFLCVRRASHISVFEPLLCRDTVAYSSGRKRSALNPNHLVTINASATGGKHHVDVAFHPLNHRRLGVVDEEGNWSTWVIEGRRSPTARMLYQARLGSSGKIFSWKDKKRPGGIGVYFDGWHKLLWASSNGQEVDRLLVCNRQLLKMISLEGEEICSVDVRLDTGKINSYILDIRSGSNINIFLVLTTWKVLLFDCSQREWRDPANARGPALLCAYQHHHNPASLSLKLTGVSFGNDTIICLYCSDSRTLSLRRLTTTRNQEHFTAAISDMRLLDLPEGLSASPIATILLLCSEVKAQGLSLSLRDQAVVRVVIQHEDLSIYTFLAATTEHGTSQNPTHGSFLLRMPPNKNSRNRSERYVDEVNYEDDLADFIACELDEDDPLTTRHGTPYNSTSILLNGVRNPKNMDLLLEMMEEYHASTIKVPMLSVDEALEELVTRLQLLEASDKISSRGKILSDMLGGQIKIGDIELDSTKLEKDIDTIPRGAAVFDVYPCTGIPSTSLLAIYGTCFSTFIKSLQSDVPDRIRVNKERESRSIALEQYLSRYRIQFKQRSADTVVEATAGAVDSSQAILSDPIEHKVPEYASHNQVSASQPARQIATLLSETPQPTSQKVLSPLSTSTARLSSYTSLSLVSAVPQDDSTEGSRILTSLLSHLPESSDVNPDEYDYQSVLLSMHTEGASGRGKDVHGRSRAQRKADRLLGARRRAEGIDGGLGTAGEEDSQMIEGQTSRRVGFMDEVNQNGRREMLPIRVSGPKHTDLGSHNKLATVQQQQHHASDGHLPAEVSSPVTNDGFMASTQPERGIFANRLGGNNLDKSRKKKKRVAGF